jgi:O-succinylbenzoic acid--CoA ligase
LVIEGEKQLLDEHIVHWTSIKSQKKFYIDKFIETENGKIKEKKC